MNSKTFLFLVASPLLALVMVFLLVIYLATKSYNGPDVEFSIRSGEGFASINYRLKKQDIISSSRIFHYYSKLSGNLTHFKEGTFLLKHGSSMGEIIDQLVNGKPLTTKVSIPEGKNMYEVAQIYEQFGICRKEDFLKQAQDPSLLIELGIQAEKVEGYLFPETYQFPKNTPARNVVKKMVHVFNEKIKELDLSTTTLSLHELVTLASIVEKETGAKFERPMIAGIFHNRLKKRMRLESDPTTIYGIWEHFNGNLRRDDLQEVTPYNTYKIPGLPLGPIANPGLDALKATLKPSEHHYLFFVSKNDGTHIFSENYREHEKAVVHFQKTRANREGKSWRDLKQ